MTPWTVAREAPLSMGFPRQEYWSGFPFHSTGDLPDPRIKSTSSALVGRFFTTEPPLLDDWGAPISPSFTNVLELAHSWLMTEKNVFFPTLYSLLKSRFFACFQRTGC